MTEILQIGRDALFALPGNTYDISIYSSGSDTPPRFDSQEWEPCAFGSGFPRAIQDYPAEWPLAVRYPPRFGLIGAQLNDLTPEDMVELAIQSKSDIEEALHELFQVSDPTGQVTERVWQERLKFVSSSRTLRQYSALLSYRGTTEAAVETMTGFLTKVGWKVTPRATPDEDSITVGLGMTGQDGRASGLVLATRDPEFQGFTFVLVVLLVGQYLWATP